MDVNNWQKGSKVFLIDIYVNLKPIPDSTTRKWEECLFLNKIFSKVLANSATIIHTRYLDILIEKIDIKLDYPFKIWRFSSEEVIFGEIK